MADNDFLDQVNVFIKSLHDRLIPNKSLMISIAEEMHASVMNNFQTQGASVGGWAPLAVSTLKQKRKKGFAETILQQRGFLVRSFQTSATDNESVVSTNKVQARILNDGGIIQMNARTRTLFHRTDRKGNLLKQADNDKLLIFAKKSHKNKSAYTFGQSAYQIEIVARPFMILTETYSNNIINIIIRHVQMV